MPDPKKKKTVVKKKPVVRKKTPPKKKPVVKKKSVVKKSPSSKYMKVRKDDSATLNRLRKQYPNNAVVPIRNSSSYRVIGKGGRGSMTVTPGRRKKK